MDCILELKQEVDAMNQKIDSAVTALWEFKVQVQRVKMDYIVIVVVCVGVAVGCLLSKIKQSLWSFYWS
jgi:predicted acetyltransferase